MEEKSIQRKQHQRFSFQMKVCLYQSAISLFSIFFPAARKEALKECTQFNQTFSVICTLLLKFQILSY